MYTFIALSHGPPFPLALHIHIPTQCFPGHVVAYKHRSTDAYGGHRGRNPLEIANNIDTQQYIQSQRESDNMTRATVHSYTEYIALTYGDGL